MGNPRMLVFFFIAFITVAQSLPFVVLHGIGDKCKHQGIYHFIELLSDWSESQGYCIEIGNGSWDSWTMPLTKQIKKISDLRQGYNIVGFSQGNLIARGIIEFCDRGPPVKRLNFDNELDPPYDMADYLSGCKFLPKLNNEIASERNSTYKDRFSSLQNLVLIMFENDTIIIPKETAWFGYYPDGAFHPVLAPQQTKLYTEDWIGLRTLDEAGKVKFISVSGDHLRISESDIKTYIVPYLKDHISMVTTYNTKNRRTLI
ncbi:hypothetical protein TanjilG_17718 [Lupinus angustifolius]|uniref:Palmitoyl-protein thioesterase 1 n=1 Tax=Lupinus angustifolius TaxID=3871 RepID=A0A1J7HFM0_LUPAN|nr:hypothetical protein TanjilG_17718 [Lupinus angustifolius]